MYNSIVFIFLIITSESNCIGLDELEEIDYNYISSVAVHRSRAFLALPRSVCPNNKSTPTVLETYWDGGNGDIFSRFSHKIIRHLSSPSHVWANCDTIQDAISLSMEPLKPKLWILDKGNEFCSPKILSYNFIFNQIAETMELTNVDGKKLNTMVIDYFGNDPTRYKAYIGLAEDNVLLVICLRKLVWWKIYLVKSTRSSGPVKADFLAISKISPDLFITAKDELDLYSVSLKGLRLIEEPYSTETKGDTLYLNVTFHGKKLGHSTGIETDFDSGVIYYLVRDYAIVRWKIGYPMEAEYHSVLAQSYESFPYISGFFTDPENSIWAIVNPRSPDYCNTINSNSESSVELTDRVVRITTYNKFTKETDFEDILED